MLLHAGGTSARSDKAYMTTSEIRRAGAGASVDLRSINAIRFLSADAVQKAKSGHPGAPMGLAPAAYVLWDRFLKHSPHNPNWPDRDRFVLSAGHASMLLYSLLHLTGYDLSIDEIKNFRQIGPVKLTRMHDAILAIF